MSASAADGLRVTLFGTLALLEYLRAQGFKYLMALRLSQDPLESFFWHCKAVLQVHATEVLQVFQHLFSLPNSGPNVDGGRLSSCVCVHAWLLTALKCCEH